MTTLSDSTLAVGFPSRLQASFSAHRECSEGAVPRGYVMREIHYHPAAGFDAHVNESGNAVVVQKSLDQEDAHAIVLNRHEARALARWLNEIEEAQKRLDGEGFAGETPEE